MSEFSLHSRDTHPDIEYLDDEEELHRVLEAAAPFIGRIVIEFNSLEDSLSFCIKELVSHSEGGDEQIYVFLAEMGYSSKVTALVNLYGQLISYCHLDLSEKLNNLEALLRDAAKYRNQYAHANWVEISKSNYVLTKVRAGKSGVFHAYRKFDEEQMDKDLGKIKAAHAALEFFDAGFREQMQKQR
ncbi:MAG: hypothetical protein ACYC1T_13510 [Sulfuricaulis sp.]